MSKEQFLVKVIVGRDYWCSNVEFVHLAVYAESVLCVRSE